MMSRVGSNNQDWYWSMAWQEKELEARRALAEGEYVEFDSADSNDVVEWLLDEHS